METIARRPPAQQAGTPREVLDPPALTRNPASPQSARSQAHRAEPTPVDAPPVGDLDLPDDLLRERYHEVKRLITERQKSRYPTPAQRSVTSCLVIKADAMHEELLRREERRREAGRVAS